MDIAKQGGVNDTITYATTPSLAQENAVKLLTNLLINGNPFLHISLTVKLIPNQEKLDLNYRKPV